VAPETRGFQLRDGHHTLVAGPPYILREGRCRGCVVSLPWQLAELQRR